MREDWHLWVQFQSSGGVLCAHEVTCGFGEAWRWGQTTAFKEKREDQGQFIRLLSLCAILLCVCMCVFLLIRHVQGGSIKWDWTFLQHSHFTVRASSHLSNRTWSPDYNTVQLIIWIKNYPYPGEVPVPIFYHMPCLCKFLGFLVSCHLTKKRLIGWLATLK